MLVILAGCTSEPLTLDGPDVVHPSVLVPYARRVDWTLDREVTVEGVATDGVHTIPIAYGPAREHAIPLVGLYADADWTVELVATDERGRSVTAPTLTFHTEPLPAPFPQMQVRVSDLDRAEPGLTLLPLTHITVAAWLVAVDLEGQVAWLYDGENRPVFEAHPVPGVAGGLGGVRMLQGTQMFELDWLGGERYRLESLSQDLGPPGVEVEGAWGFNHELTETDHGTWLGIGKEVHEVPSFPVSYDDPAVREDSTVNSDVVLEIDPDRAEIVRSWSVYEHLDVERLAYGSLEGAYLGFDWSHANAVSARGDEWLVSLRHQDAIVLVDSVSGDVEYILGTHDNWRPPWDELLLTPVGEPFDWPWHQHGVKLLEDDRVLVFDNGNFRASPWTGVPKLENELNRSRVVQFAVDRAARTVRQEWSVELDPTVYSAAMGDADALPNGNVLGAFSYVLFEGGQSNASLGRRIPSGRVAELDPDDGATVWDLDVWAPDDGSPGPGWQVFRAQRFSGFE